MSQTKAQLLGPVLGDVNYDSGTLFVDSTNNKVGIGTTNPELQLSIYGRSNIVSPISGITDSLTLTTQTNTAGDVWGIGFGNPIWGIKSAIHARNDNDGNGAGSLIFETKSSASVLTERLRLTSSGNVGIGTTNPSNLLSLYQSGGPVIRLTEADNGAFSLISNGGGNLVFSADHGNTASGTSISFGVDGNQTKLFISELGNIGIGTNSPTSKLQVHGDSGSSYFVFRGGSAAGGYGGFINSSGTTIGYLGNGGGGAITAGTVDNFVIRSEADLIIAAGGNAEKIRLTSSGNVGIGTTNPSSSKLHLYGAAGESHQLKIERGGTGAGVFDIGISHVDASTYGTVYFTSDTAGNTSDFIFRHGATSGYSEKFRIKSNGNIGIGITNPTAKLEIAVDSTTVVTDATFSPRILIHNKSSSYSTRIGGAIDFEGVYGGLGRIAISKENGGSSGTGRDFGIFHLRLNSDVNNDSYNAFQDALIISPGSSTTDGGFSYNWRGESHLRITSAGNVGIGTTNPGRKFSIQGTDNNFIELRHATRSGIHYIEHSGVNSESLAFFQNNGTTTDAYARIGRDYTIFYRGSPATEVFYIDSTGNVGIGTTNPSAKLDVNGGTGVSSGISIRSGVSNRGNIYYDGVQSLVIHGSSAPSGNDLKTLEFATGGTTPSTRMVITRDGNVGIGRTEPADILDVDGSPRFRGERVVTGGTKKHVFKGYVSGQGSVSHTITGLGGESSHLVVCVMNHFGLLSYGCTLMAFASQSPNFTTSEIHRTDTSLGGNWSISKPTNGSLTITKNAGSYVGGGNYLVMVYSTN